MIDRNFVSSTSRAVNTFFWPPVLFIGALAAAWLLSRLAPLPWPGLEDAPAHWVGLSFGALGFLLIAFALKALVEHRTSNLPNKSSTALVTNGPYGRFRNPIYLGEVLLLFCGAEITKSIWFVASALIFGVLVTLLQIIPEERHLETVFGEAYLDYKARTRRWI